MGVGGIVLQTLILGAVIVVVAFLAVSFAAAHPPPSPPPQPVKPTSAAAVLKSAAAAAMGPKLAAVAPRQGGLAVSPTGLMPDATLPPALQTQYYPPHPSALLQSVTAMPTAARNPVPLDGVESAGEHTVLGRSNQPMTMSEAQASTQADVRNQIDEKFRVARTSTNPVTANFIATQAERPSFSYKQQYTPHMNIWASSAGRDDPSQWPSREDLMKGGPAMQYANPVANQQDVMFRGRGLNKTASVFSPLHP